MSDAGLHVHGLDALFRPAAIAVIGASDDPSRIGGRPIRYLIDSGYSGHLYPVNPRYTTVQGLTGYPSVGAIGAPVDMAIVALAAPLVVDAIRECAAAGVKAVVVFSGGFAEVDAAGEERQRELAQVAAETGIRILGPNCLGLMNAHTGMIATFSASMESGGAVTGNIGFVSQSGAFGSHCFAAARLRGLGFSSWVTTGNEVDVDFADCLAYLATDPDTDVIVAYLEGVRNGARFHEALGLAQRNGKPVIMLKVGRSDVGARAAASHTASLVGSDAAYDAVFRHYGVQRVATIAEMLDVTEAAAKGTYPRGNRVGLVTVSGGVGILLADAAADCELDVRPMPLEAQQKLRELWPYAGVQNPVDTTAQTINQPDLMGKFVDTMLDEGDYDALVVFLTHVGLAPEIAGRILEPLAKARARFPDRPVVVSMMATPAIRADFLAADTIVVEDPTAAVTLVKALVSMGSSLRRGRTAEVAPEAPLPVLPPGRLGEHDVKQLLAAAGVPGLAERVVRDEDSAVAAAEAIGGPVVLKVASPAIAHKTEIQGVLLGVEGEHAVREGFRALIARAARAVEGADGDGVLVAPMVSAGVELIMGMKHDEVLGPLVVLGTGGVAAELHNDVVVRVPPLDRDESRATIGELRSWPLLTGWRGGPVADVEALVDALTAFSHVAVAWQHDLDSLEVNPLVALPAGQGVVALDALLVRRNP